MYFILGRDYEHIKEKHSWNHATNFNFLKVSQWALDIIQTIFYNESILKIVIE